MKEKNDVTTENAAECGEGCGCNAQGMSTGNKWLICVVVFLFAATLTTYRLVNKANAGTETANAAFDTNLPLSVDEDSSAKPVVFDKGDLWAGEIKDLMSLNPIAVEKNIEAVFVFLPGKDSKQTIAIKARIEDAAGKIKAQGISLAAFTLARGSKDYKKLNDKYSVPSVLTLVAAGSMSVVSNDITSQKLMEAYVKSSKPRKGGCCSGPDKSKCNTSNGVKK